MGKLTTLLFLLLCAACSLAQEQLFAVLGAGGCAQSLPYGPQTVTKLGSADNQHPLYLSTASGSEAARHDSWTQVVTSDGEAELFRVRWIFSSSKTLSKRFEGASAVGEPVNYLVIDASNNEEYAFSGVWWFSSDSELSAAKFAGVTDDCCFSASSGVWGAGNGTIDGSDDLSTSSDLSFWGIGAWNGEGDGGCASIYKNGVKLTEFGTNARSYLYFDTEVVPSAEPTAEPSLAPTPEPTTAAPSLNPTRVPSVKPTSTPTIAPTFDGSLAGVHLFAVLSTHTCAESLYYGPQAITTAGSADGRKQYLSTGTRAKDVPHDTWEQAVTIEGQSEVLHITWRFSTFKTLAQRMVDAVTKGEPVTYTVTDRQYGGQYSYSGVWWFSNAAGDMASKFASPDSRCCFSADSGVWGAGSGVINGNGDAAGYVASSFWGVGNWESSDIPSCAKIYRDGRGLDPYPFQTKTFMSYVVNPDPTAAPTVPPSGPSHAPTLSPTPAPTFTSPPTMATFPPVAGPGLLFAVVGGAECAERLFYGPKAITATGTDEQEFYLSTATPGRDVPHRYWTQVVTSDGVTELFRIYWTFDTPRTLAQHFVTATSQGVKVSYRVVTPSGDEHSFTNSTWWFNDDPPIAPELFDEPSTMYGFSARSGVWGAGLGALKPAGISHVYHSVSFWGIGNWANDDYNQCFKIFMGGEVVHNIHTWPASKTYMYYSAEAAPTAAPTRTPTTAPVVPTASPSTTPTAVATTAPSVAPSRVPTTKPTTVSPTPAPSPSPTAAATFPPNVGPDVLFAIVGGDQCANNLPYGPQPITTAGTADGYGFYLSTATPARDVPHRFWTQVVTSDGVTELFRIYWTFDTPRTLAQHFVTATSQGVKVSYRVVTAAGVEYSFPDSTWWFSDGAITLEQFDTPTTSLGFAGFSAWGAGSEVIRPNYYIYTWSFVHFWGVGRWAGNGDYHECNKIYRDGSYYYTSDSPPSKTLMYYSVDDATDRPPTAAPTVLPTNSRWPTFTPTSAAPIAAPTLAGKSTVHIDVEQEIRGVDWWSYTAAPDAFNAAIIDSIAQSINGVTPSDVTNFRVDPGNGRRKLRGAGGVSVADAPIEAGDSRGSTVDQASATPTAAAPGRQHPSVQASISDPLRAVPEGPPGAAAGDPVGQAGPIPTLRDPPDGSSGTAVTSGSQGLLSYGDSLLVSYAILLTDSTYSYDALEYAVHTSVSLGHFDEVLRSQAAVYNLSALSHASSTMIGTHNGAPPADDDSSEDSALPMGAIAGIAAGGGAAMLILLAAAVYFCWYRAGTSAALTAVQPTQQQPECVAPATGSPPADDINVYFYGSGVPHAAMPMEQALVPSAPAVGSDFALGADGQAHPGGTHAEDLVALKGVAHANPVSVTSIAVAAHCLPVAAHVDPAYPLAYGEDSIVVAEV